jgi:hypothetical protein
MALIDANWNPSERQLKQFGWALFPLLPFLGWTFLGFRALENWSPLNELAMGGLVLAGLALAVVATVRPSVVRPLFIAVSLVTFPIGLVVGELALLIIYLGVFLPVGLMFRIMRRDVLARHSGRDRATTYWTPKRPPNSIEQYFHQY